MPALILCTSQGRGSTEQSHAYPVDSRDAGHEAAQQLQRAAVLNGQPPVRCKLLPAEQLPA
jgi:hypothetical protein